MYGVTLGEIVATMKSLADLGATPAMQQAVIALIAKMQGVSQQALVALVAAEKMATDPPAGS